MSRLPERSSHRLRGWRLSGLLLLLSLLPLALLAYSNLTMAEDAVREEVEARMSSTAAISADRIYRELEGLSEVVDSYAGRRTLIAALAGEDRARYDRSMLTFHLRELQKAQEGIYATGLAEPGGKLIDVVPATPSIVGKDYSFRDWYKGVTRTGRAYVSEAYRTQARGRPHVVAAATLVRDQSRDGRPGQVLGILVAAYDLEHLRSFSDELAAAENVKLKVTDQRGVLVASPGPVPRNLVPVRDDPRVRAALEGRSGVIELDTPDGRRLSAYAPVPEIGWTVTASVPANAAFAAIGGLRSTTLTIASLLALLLLAGVALLARALRGRERAEEAARRQVSINEAVLDAAVDGIAMFDREGRVVMANAAAQRMAESHGVEAPEGAALVDLAAAIKPRTRDPEAYWASVEAIAADPEYEGTREYELADSGKAFRSHTAPVRDAEGNVIGRIFTVREVTGEREAERLKNELMATVSHELRTPLASILGFAELLVDRKPDGATRDRYLATIHSEARRLTKLINDFLDLQRIEEGHFTLNLEPVELGKLLREQVEVFGGQSEAHTLELDLPAEAAPVLGDGERIAQVVANLISNAIKYSPSGGPVRLAARADDGVLRVSVSDSGLGIPADQQRKLFTKFFRVDTSDTRAIGGTGLGLALCREIVEAHGGRIGFDSVEGEGSTFWFTLPAAQHRNGTGARRVLVIEDDPAASSLLVEYLTADGYEVETAATGEQGLARAEQDPPAVVCLDIFLPGELDGWQVLSQLKENPATERIPVVVCTVGNDRYRARALGAADFITKPFSQRRLQEAIARVLPEGRGSVLVVDDEESVRRLVQETLSGNGVELREAADGESALAEVAVRRPDAIVLDLIMPGLDGFEVLERLQDDPETRGVPVIVLTARQLSAEERHSLKTRAVSLLEKSAYSPQELRRLIGVALGE